MSDEQDIEAWSASKKVDEKAAYLNQGRKFKSLSDEQLKELYIQTYKTLVEEPFNDDARVTSINIGFEYQLRGGEAPLDLVREYANQFVSEVSAAFEAQSPEGAEASNRAMQADIDAFLNEKDKSKN